MVRCSIGPRQATATPAPSAGSTNMPIEMTFTPWATGGRIMSPTCVGLHARTPSASSDEPRMPGIEKP